jgi:hypothetical protein
VAGQANERIREEGRGEREGLRTGEKEKYFDHSWYDYTRQSKDNAYTPEIHSFVFSHSNFLSHIPVIINFFNN